MSTGAPLLSFRAGKFSLLEKEPEFLQRATAIGSELGIEDWEEILSKAGLRRADTFKGVTGDFEFATIDIYMFENENGSPAYYAELWDQLTPLWRAIFGAEDLPDFYRCYVFPLISTATLLSIQARIEKLSPLVEAQADRSPKAGR